MNNNRFIHSVLVFVILTVGLLIGCSGQTEDLDKLTANEVAEHIEKLVKFDNMTMSDMERLQKLFNLDNDIVSDFVLYISPSNVRADELAVIKVNDASEVERVVQNIEQRVKAQANKFKDYRPNEYYLIDHHVIKTKGEFVLFVVHNDAELIVKAFEEILK